MQRRYRILVIEDSPTQAARLCRLLEGEDSEVVCASSAEQGFEQINLGIPDLIIVDYYLPGLKGDEFCRKVRMNLNTRNVPMLMLTVGGSDAVETRGLESGADDYLAKSVDPDILLLRVRALLRKSPAQDAIFGVAGKFLRRARLLVADDSPTYLQYLVRQLQAEDYEVAAATGGDQALEMIAGEPFDCVLIDVEMPGPDGIAVCRRIRQAYPAVDSPIIVLMVPEDEDKSEIARGLTEGADDFVSKSGDIGVLKARLRALLRRKFFQEENRHILEELKNREMETVRARAEREAAEARAVLAEKLAETDRELRYQHTVTKAIADNAAESLFMLDAEGRITFLNPAAVATFGFAAEEMLGEVLYGKLDVRAADGRDPLGVVLATREALKGQEAVFTRKDGTPVDVSCSYSPILREGGVTAAVAVVHDISERKRSEERLRQSQKLESIGLLAGGVAHDFNNLLTVIMGSASSALQECPSCEHSQAILSASERASYLTKQLLAYAGKGQAVLKIVDLTELVSQAATLLSASVPKRVSLRFNLSKDLPCLEADPSRIDQILMNFVINAGEAIPAKSDGLIEITTSSCEVTPEMAHQRSSAYDIAPGVFVCLEVRDNGAGMDSATVSRIFDPFFSTKFTGRGLGLAAVYGIIRSSKGFIDVKSAPGAGTTFRVFLPASEKKSSAAPAPSVSQRQPVGGNATILVVDDEEMVRKLACMSLRRYGYDVLEAKDGRDALQVIADSPSPPSLILLDLAMPVMGGDELIPILEQKYPGVRIIVSSGYPEEDARRGFRSESVVGFLQKPYTTIGLGEKVGAALAGGPIQRHKLQ